MIAVIIPAFNAARFLPACLQTVRNQTLPPAEICLVDDGSCDGTAALASAWSDDIQIVHQPNRGAAAARNAGIRATRSPLLAFLDADDLWPPDHNVTLRRAIEARHSLIAIGRTQMVRDPSDGADPRRVTPQGSPWHGPLFGSAVIKREAFDRTGPIDETLPRGEDLDWFIRARELQLPTVMVPSTTLLYRRHSTSLTSGADPTQRNILLALKRSLDRRRCTMSGP